MLRLSTFIGEVMLCYYHSEVLHNVDKTRQTKEFQRFLGLSIDIQITSFCLTAHDGTTSVGVLTSDRMIKSDVGAIV